MPSLVICAHSLGSPVMGGDRARVLLAQRLRKLDFDVTVCLYSDLPDLSGCDVYVMESPVKRPDMEIAKGRAYAVLRHGDCQIANCAHDSDALIITPTHWALHQLGWRMPRTHVQWMALEPIAGARAEHGRKVLHLRAFDFQKDSELACKVALCLPGVEFVFRAQAGARRAVVPDNVTVLEATTDQEELWRDVGCLLVTSRYETFCMAAYEALARGIPVVAHSELAALREWGGTAIYFASHPSEFAADVQAMLNGFGRSRREHLLARAQFAHARALAQSSALADTLKAMIW